MLVLPFHIHFRANEDIFQEKSYAQETYVGVGHFILNSVDIVRGKYENSQNIEAGQGMGASGAVAFGACAASRRIGMTLPCLRPAFGQSN